MIFKRFSLTIILLVLAFFAPWWLWFLAVVAAALSFNNFYEAVAVAIVYDLVLGTTHTTFNGLPFAFSIVTLAVVLIISPLRYRLWR